MQCDLAGGPTDISTWCSRTCPEGSPTRNQKGKVRYNSTN